MMKSSEEFLRDINMIYLNDKLSWVERNNRILKLIQERDSKINVNRNSITNADSTLLEDSLKICLN